MSTLITILILVFIYLIIGRVYTNIAIKFGVVDKDVVEEITLVTIFYPIIIIWKIAMNVADIVTKILFEKRSKNI
jgi:hypothetical protein